MEENESTQRLQQQLASLPDLINGNVVVGLPSSSVLAKNDQSATTTTETVATSTSSFNKNQNQNQLKRQQNDDGQSSLPSSTTTTTTSTMVTKNLDNQTMKTTKDKRNESNSGKDKDDNDDDDDDNDQPSIIVLNNNKDDQTDQSSDQLSDDRSTGSINPKLIFIERLMDLNFQQQPSLAPPPRSPQTGLSSFFDMRNSPLDSDSNKTTTVDNSDDSELSDWR